MLCDSGFQMFHLLSAVASLQVPQMQAVTEMTPEAGMLNWGLDPAFCEDTVSTYGNISVTSDITMCTMCLIIILLEDATKA